MSSRRGPTPAGKRDEPARHRVATTARHRVRWLVLRVILAREAGEDLTDPPGRDLLVNDAHTFGELAAAIDRCFARWDLAHLHQFRLADGRRIGPADEDAEEDELDEALETLAVLRGASRFVYEFDIGAGWGHDCTVLRDNVDPLLEAGVVPGDIVPIFGWGAIPDQYGRRRPDDDDS